MDKYQVSIIVPIYNVECYLQECIDSLLRQTYANIEVILVNDGSKDNCGYICDRYASNYENIKVIHKLNGGLVSAWTEGLKQATADWVTFVDGDDYIEPHYIEYLVKEQIDNLSDIVVTRMKQIDSKGEKYIPFVVQTGCYKGNKLIEELYPVMINAREFEKRGVPFSRCSKLIRKSLMIQNLQYLYDKATYEEDFNIMAPTLMDATGISLIETENAAYCYRRVESSMLHGYSTKMETSIRNIYPKLYDACREKNKLVFLNQIDAEYVSAFVRLYTNELRNNAGYKVVRKNIKKISVDDRFRKLVNDNRIIKNFPFCFKLVVYALKNYNSISEKILTKIFYIASKHRK